MKKNVFYILMPFCVILLSIPFKAACCTSWMVFSDLTGNNTNILHKNRDSAIAMELNEQNIRTRQGKKWDTSYIKRML